MHASTLISLLAGGSLALAAALPGGGETPPTYSGGSAPGAYGSAGSTDGGYGGASGGYGGASGGVEGSGSGGSGWGNGEQPFQCASPLQGDPVCCEVNALGVVSATCTPPKQAVYGQDGFRAYCAQTGTTAQCCILGNVATLGVVCQEV